MTISRMEALLQTSGVVLLKPTPQMREITIPFREESRKLSRWFLTILLFVKGTNPLISNFQN